MAIGLSSEREGVVVVLFASEVHVARSIEDGPHWSRETKET